MKLWIRSADREHFTEAHGIDYNMGYIVNSMTEEERYCHKIVDDRGKVLGIYETKERCLEIIDEIQKLLEVADPTKAFLNIECDELLDYNDVMGIIEFTRKHNAGYVPNGKVELIMPNVITYQMPEK